MRERHGTPSPLAIHHPARSWLICRRPLIPRLGAGDYMRPTDEREPARGGRARDEKVFPCSRCCVLSLLKRRPYLLIPIPSSRIPHLVSSVSYSSSRSYPVAYHRLFVLRPIARILASDLRLSPPCLILLDCPMLRERTMRKEQAWMGTGQGTRQTRRNARQDGTAIRMAARNTETQSGMGKEERNGISDEQDETAPI